ncbi:MAG: UbiA family prenyltransferase [Planctomycetota bacterium]|nr:UbiA family prenyltransferase [Planctomycetota bacterium]
MTDHASSHPAPSATTDGRPAPTGVAAWFALVRPRQWAKNIFVVVGPAYGFAVDRAAVTWSAVALATLAFCVVSSACYIINDARDIEADRHHPRKKRRPLASGAIAPGAAYAACGLLFVAGGAIAAWMWSHAGAGFGVLLLAYAANVILYSLGMKRAVVLDVISLAMGFVFRVLAGCVAAGVTPSPWLLNCTFFVSMFLAFGKRLGERRTMESGTAAEHARAVQGIYTDATLRMFVVVTGVACLLSYAGYIQAQSARHSIGGMAATSTPGVAEDASRLLAALPLWLTLLPATYGLLRSIVLMDKGTFDDPTELVWRDRATQAAIAVFIALTAWAMMGWR